jgi:acetyltransferase-like isoleucine patch superfamily enzyme
LTRAAATARTYLLRRSGVRIAYGAQIVNRRGVAIAPGASIESTVTLVGGESPPSLLQVGASTIRGGTYLSARHGCVTIGHHGYIGHDCWIGGRGQIEIGEWFLCAPKVVIISSNHDFRDRSRPYSEQAEIAGVVTIADNVWIGANSVILPGATIGSGAVVGAGSVVRDGVPAGAMAAGVPARVLRQEPAAERAFRANAAEGAGERRGS